MSKDGRFVGIAATNHDPNLNSTPDIGIEHETRSDLVQDSEIPRERLW